MDFVHGTNLMDVWYDKSWWNGPRSKRRTLESIARHMVQLSSIEFTQIGVLERDDATSGHFIAPLSYHALCPLAEGPDRSLGPFDTQSGYLRALLVSAQMGKPSAARAFVGLFIDTLLETRYDVAPFTLSHPDLYCWNVFVDESTSEVTAFIDWDELAALPRQLGALTYPNWLTTDWNPVMHYKLSKMYEHADDLHSYRAIYLHAVHK